MKEKVVLAYSGGLDTTAIIPWLKETFDYDVVCCCIDCGQGNELDGLEQRAKMSGASKLYIENVIDEFCDDFIVHVCRQTLYMKINTCLAQVWPAGHRQKLVEIAAKKAL